MRLCGFTRLATRAVGGEVTLAADSICQPYVCSDTYFTPTEGLLVQWRYLCAGVNRHEAKPPPGQITSAVQFLNSGKGLKTVRLGLVTLATRFDLDAGQRASPQRIGDVRDRELLPRSSLSNQCAGSLVECEYRSAEERVTATWARATKPDRTHIASLTEFAHKCH